MDCQRPLARTADARQCFRAGQSESMLVRPPLQRKATDLIPSALVNVQREFLNEVAVK